MWIGRSDSVDDPTHFVMKDCSRRPPTKLEVPDSSREIGDYFGGRSQLLLLVEKEV